MKKKKVLVTGSGGFIFSNFIRRAFRTKQPYNLSSLDRVREGQAYNVYLNQDHKFYVCDIRDRHVLDVVFQIESPDVVVHGAAESFVDNSIENAQPFITSNILGTQNIIDACLKWNVKKLVYISTDEVYGHLTDEDAAAWTEDALMNPRNPYAASKASGELLVRAAHQTHGLTFNITRSCNNYGPWQHQEKLLPKIVKSVLHGQKMPVYGQGLQIRDWLHVHDNCDAIFRIINDGVDNETYNISAGQELPNIEVFQRVCNVIEECGGPHGHELIEFVKDRPGHDFRYSIDSSKLRALGWSPEYRFNDGINQTIAWYINNQFCLKD